MCNVNVDPEVDRQGKFDVRTTFAEPSNKDLKYVIPTGSPQHLVQNFRLGVRIARIGALSDVLFHQINMALQSFLDSLSVFSNVCRPILDILKPRGIYLRK